MSLFVCVCVCVCRYMFGHVPDQAVNRMLPHHNLTALSHTFFLNQGIQAKGSRSWRTALPGEFHCWGVVREHV